MKSLSLNGKQVEDAFDLIMSTPRNVTAFADYIELYEKANRCLGRRLTDKEETKLAKYVASKHSISEREII